MYNSKVLIDVLQVNALETSAVLIETFNDKSEVQASSGTSKFAKHSDGGQWIATVGVKLVKVLIISNRTKTSIS